MRGRKPLCVVLAVFLISACDGVVDFKSAPAPSPPGDDAPASNLELRWVEWDKAWPDPRSQETFDFVVEVANRGEESFEWPDPCPTYSWAWGESATEYGAGFGYLNCDGVGTLQPGDVQQFQMEVPAADSTSATTLGWRLVDPRSCNFMTASFGEEGEVFETQAGTPASCSKTR